LDNLLSGIHQEKMRKQLIVNEIVNIIAKLIWPPFNYASSWQVNLWSDSRFIQYSPTRLSFQIKQNQEKGNPVILSLSVFKAQVLLSAMKGNISILIEPSDTHWIPAILAALCYQDNATWRQFI
jgi:hypothetical protein